MWVQVPPRAPSNPDDLGSQRTRSLHYRIKIVYLEPKQHPVSRRRGIRVDEVGVIFRIPSVQLKNQAPGRGHPLVQITVTVFRERVRAKQFAE